MNLLITGALGHIGSRLIREISPRRVNRLLLLDNLSAHRQSSLFNLRGEVACRFIEDDVCTADLDRCFEGVDVVIHLAAITNAEGSFTLRDEVEHTNYEGAKRVAEACARAGARLVFISTTSVYGPQREVVDEDCREDELKPQSPYAESKLRAERMLEETGREAGLRFVTCRFGTIFGASPGMRFHTAVNKFIWQACTGRPATVWRTALHQKRPYLELGDAVAAISHIVDNDLFDNRIYNVLTANATVNEILEVIRLSVPDLQVGYVDSPIMNQLSYTVSSRRFLEQGFEFRGTLRQGIGEVIDLLRGLSPGRPPLPARHSAPETAPAYSPRAAQW
ncbi:MAG: NAD-dependent epimerase/dehydratase family protein [Blastocatellia bacterium]